MSYSIPPYRRRKKRGPVPLYRRGKQHVPAPSRSFEQMLKDDPTLAAKITYCPSPMSKDGHKPYPLPVYLKTFYEDVIERSYPIMRSEDD